MKRRFLVSLRSFAAVAWILACLVYAVDSRGRLAWTSRHQYRQSDVDLFQHAFADQLESMQNEKRVGFVARATVWSLEPGAGDVTSYYTAARFALTPASLLIAPLWYVPQDERPSHMKALTGPEGAWSGIKYIIVFHSDDATSERFITALKQSGYEVIGQRRWMKLVLVRKR